MTPGLRPCWKCWLCLPAESWHQQALPGEVPSGRWGCACTHGVLSSLYPQGWARMGRALGPTPSEARGTSIFSPSLLALPVFQPSLSLPFLYHSQYGDHPETIYCSC